EAHAVDLLGDQIGIVAQHAHGVGAVALADALRERRAEPEPLQIRQLLRLVGATAHRLRDRVHAPRADPADLAQARRLRGDHLERLVAEALHDARGQRRPDSGHQARAEVALDARARARRDRREALDLEALAVLRVLLEAPAHRERLADHHTAQIADRGEL